MSRTIWKYELAVTDVQKVAMPKGAELLMAAGQEVREVSERGVRLGTYPMLWALVDPSRPLVDHLVALVGTGNPAPDGHEAYIGSAICGPFVWHVFDGGERPPIMGGDEVTTERNES